MALLALALAACAAPIHTDGRADGVLSSAEDLERGLFTKSCKGRIKGTMTGFEAVEACQKGKCSFCARKAGTINYLADGYVAKSAAKGVMRLADGLDGEWLYQCTSNPRRRHGRKKFILFGKRVKEEQCPPADGWKVLPPRLTNRQMTKLGVSQKEDQFLNEYLREKYQELVPSTRSKAQKEDDEYEAAIHVGFNKGFLFSDD